MLFLATGAWAQSGLEGWHAEGQTWLVWQHDRDFAEHDTYEIYQASAPIESLESAQRVGRILPADWEAWRLQLQRPGATWTLPDAAGGRRTLSSGEALFVFTPHAVRDDYFAVVAHGESEIRPGCAVGPVRGSLAPVTCHVVDQGSDAGHAYTTYALWIDGRADFESGRANFPVMGNEGVCGVASLFNVYEPSTGLPAEPMPMVAGLHGGGGSFRSFSPDRSEDVRLDLSVEDGLYVTFDNPFYSYMDVRGVHQVTATNARWFGHWDGFDRFAPEGGLPPADGIVFNYTQRYIDFVFQWMVEHRGVDPNRRALFGASMGGRGVSFYSRWNPDVLSVAHDMVGAFTMSDGAYQARMQGTPEMDLITNTGLSMSELYWPSHPIWSDRDLPFMRFIYGTEDSSHGWEGKPTAFADIDALRWGAHIYWDERDHSAAGGGWDDAHWVGNPRHDPARMTGHRGDVSFPAFSQVDHQVFEAGRQPDLGPAQAEPAGDPWGTWGGHLEWIPGSILDQVDHWAVSLRGIDRSPFPADIPESDVAMVDITPRRTLAFGPPEGTPVWWSLVCIDGGARLQSGVVRPGPEAPVTVPDVVLTKEPSRLMLSLPDEPTLELPTPIAGMLGTAEAQGFTPGAQVILALSVTGNSPTLTPYGWMELSDPVIEFPPQATDAQGHLHWERMVPEKYRASAMHLQAVEPRPGGSRLSTPVSLYVH